MVVNSKKSNFLIIKENGLSFIFIPSISRLSAPPKSLNYIKDFKDLDAEVIGVSVDSVYSHQRWIKDDLGDLHYPLVGDITKRISRDYGVLLEDAGIATRGTFIIDPQQKIQYMGIHNLNVGRDAAEIVRVLAGLRTGELCGAGWKKGDKHL
jgi:peroxiredoxin (alkyl hydroperoxide reductase subunit C)